MYRVTFYVEGRNRRTNYQSEKAARRGIVRWLNKHHQATDVHAILYGPDGTPEMFRDVAELGHIDTPKAPDFYQSQAWLRVRVDALANAKGCCVLCGARASEGVALHVDHIKPRSTHPELELDPDNLQVLCGPCNLGKSNRYSERW
ncbi:HNH endonuclease [Marinobacter hydrocarbonoclasticus]|nr:HNH endonuclease [Marinobacter nauticus]